MSHGGSGNSFKYWAFISYSHVDKRWGDWLHRALETYRVPKRLVGTISPLDGRLPARVFPIFRDREELPVSASLPDNINYALEQSRYLIVICSPRSAASRWVNEEIKTFKRLGREDRVLALIVDGEPNATAQDDKPGFRGEDECFPQALRWRWGNNGELSNERTEPVAADARPDKDGKRNAKLKLLAGLLQVNYDQLRQREHERRIHQLSYLVGVALVLLGVFAALAGYSEVQRQNAEAQRRNAELQQQKAEEQAQEATRQRNMAVEANRRYKAQLHESSVSDLATAGDMFTKGRWQQGIAYLGRSLEYDPENRLAATWLWNELVYGRGDRDRLPVYFTDHPAAVISIAYSYDGQRFVTGSWDNTAQQWDAATGKRIGAPFLHGGPVYSAAYSPDGQRVVTACADKTAQQWDAATGERIGEALLHKDEVLSVVYSPDGRYILTTSGHCAQRWETTTGRPIGKPIVSDNGFVDAAYSPDAQRFVTASVNGNIAQQWNATTGKPVGKPLAHILAVRSAAYSPDGCRIVTASDDGTAQQWDATTGKLLGEPLRHKDRVTSAIYSPDGQRIVTVCADNTAQQWDAATVQSVGEPIRGAGCLNIAVYSPDGQSILVAGGDIEKLGYVAKWEAATDQCVGEPLPYQALVADAAYSPDGQRIVTAGGDATARQWDAATGKPIGKPLAHKYHVWRAAYSADSQRIITRCAEDVDGRQWDASTGRVIAEPLPAKDAAGSGVYSPDGRRFVVVSEQQETAQQFDATTRKPIGAPMGDGGVFSAVFSPDGQRILTACGDKSALQWETTTSKPVGEPLPCAPAVVAAVYSPRGESIVTSCNDQTARQWETATGKPIGEPFLHGAGKTDPYDSAVTKAVYRPDGQRLLTVCHGKVWQWETVSPAEPPPRWLESLVQVTSGYRFAEGGNLLTLDLPDRLVLREHLSSELQKVPAGTGQPWQKLASWLLSPRRNRNVTPDSALSEEDLAEIEVNSGEEGFVRNARALSPEIPLVQLALAAFEENASSAEFLRRYDLRRLTPEGGLIVRAAVMLRAQGQMPLALQTLETARATSESANATELLTSLVLTRWLCDDKEGAVYDCQRLIFADATYADAASLSSVAAMSDNDRAALLAAIAETLRRQPGLDPKPGE